MRPRYGQALGSRDKTGTENSSVLYPDDKADPTSEILHRQILGWRAVGGRKGHFWKPQMEMRSELTLRGMGPRPVRHSSASAFWVQMLTEHLSHARHPCMHPTLTH